MEFSFETFFHDIAWNFVCIVIFFGSKLYSDRPSNEFQHISKVFIAFWREKSGQFFCENFHFVFDVFLNGYSFPIMK